MGTTKVISANSLNQGSATVGVQRGGATASIVKWDGRESLKPAHNTNPVSKSFPATQYGARDTSSRFDDYGLRRKTIEIGTWDMSASQTATIAHGLSNNLWKNVRNIEIVVRNDDDDTYYTDSTDTSANADDGIEIEKIDATNITIKCAAAGGGSSTFANASFDKILNSYNRGWITIWYE